ncbi:titin-like [Cynara cardunculus var. scolymus]|uniref:titin-like n=1 Tax=Cynara cardunculus var. scolymus TaxID=59895 RepID=UPI000D624E0E|nr:titin-like [Cynara cardunculus var. scolymus]
MEEPVVAGEVSEHPPRIPSPPRKKTKTQKGTDSSVKKSKRKKRPVEEESPTVPLPKPKKRKTKKAKPKEPVITEAIAEESPTEATTKPKRRRLHKMVHDVSPTEQIQDVLLNIQKEFRVPIAETQLGIEVILDDEEEEVEVLGEGAKDAEGTHPSPPLVHPKCLEALF